MLQKIKIKHIPSSQAKQLAPEIVKVYSDCWICTYPDTTLGITADDIKEKFIHIEDIEKEWKEHILGTKNRNLWVLFHDNEVVGFCIAQRESGYNELEYIYILSDYQGKGFGKQLMKKALDWLGTKKEIILFGAAYNIKAKEFYQKFGFIVSSEHIPPKKLPGGKNLPSMKMIKDTF